MTARQRCQARTEVYSRVTGFYRPVQDWNPGKQAEFLARVGYLATGEKRAGMQRWVLPMDDEAGRWHATVGDGRCACGWKAWGVYHWRARPPRRRETRTGHRYCGDCKAAIKAAAKAGTASPREGGDDDA